MKGVPSWRNGSVMNALICGVQMRGCERLYDWLVVDVAMELGIDPATALETLGVHIEDGPLMEV